MSLRHKREAWIELWQRYKATFSHFWQRRQELTMRDFKTQEAEFLPAALSIQAQPVSPTGRWVARILILLVVILFIWSFIGQFDIVVNATGKIIPSGYSKTISSVEVASVRALHVVEGQAVKAGEVLIELDTRSSDSDHDKAQVTRQTAQIQAIRARALLNAIATDRPPQLPPIPGITPEHWQESAQHLADQWRDYIAKRTRLDGEISRFSQALPLATQRANDYAELAKNKDVPQHAWLEKEQARIDIEGQLNDMKNQRAALIAELRKTSQDALNDAQRILGESTQDMRRASVRSELLKLVAPIDGTVQQLTVHTVGAAVPAAQPLMQIVPYQSALEVEAFIENKDVGFVQIGQAAAVKIDAFEYTKYGTIDGQVTQVSRDAIQDEKRGLIYAVRLQLTQSKMRVKDEDIPLGPGMSVNVEIKTGTRRIIEYVLSPLLQHGRESLNER